MNYLKQITSHMPYAQDEKEKYLSFCERLVNLMHSKITIEEFDVFIKELEPSMMLHNYLEHVYDTLLGDGIKQSEFATYHKERFDAAIKGQYDWSKLMFKDFFQVMYMELVNSSMSKDDWETN
ncbi:hypothetical protein [Aeromonas salmonicida]|uniref:hypothetical protein n=1 Tax=Aeromonas salmonicida TaxID=645 RepID=UPI003D31B3FC